MASLSSSGLDPISAAMAGSEVDITVESMFSMNSATATISGTRRSRVMVWGHRVLGPLDLGPLNLGVVRFTLVAGAGCRGAESSLYQSGKPPLESWPGMPKLMPIVWMWRCCSYDLHRGGLDSSLGTVAQRTAVRGSA